MKRFEALNWASSFLEGHHLYPNAAELLLCHMLGISRTAMFATMQESLTEDEWQRFERVVACHAEGVPVQHIIGYEGFYGRRFIVNPHVLIPRPETEELVQGVLAFLKKMPVSGNVAGGKPRVCDVGTGSGAIAISLALETSGLDVVAVDISADALTVAKQNARELGADVEFVEGDLLEPFLEDETSLPFDIVVSNPPYIPLSEKEQLDITVREHEPHLALFGGEDGYDVYKKITQQLPKVISRGVALVAFEIGHGQGEVVAALLKKAFGIGRAVDTEVRHDINGKERMVYATIQPMK